MAAQGAPGPAGSDLVDNMLDLSAIYATHQEVRGAPPYDPRLLVKLILYGYATGTFPGGWSRRPMNWSPAVTCRLTSSQTTRPSASSGAATWRRWEGSSSRGWRFASGRALVKLGHVALDGTKLNANASKRMAMSYGRMLEREPEYERVIQEWFRRAEEIAPAGDPHEFVHYYNHDRPHRSLALEAPSPTLRNRHGGIAVRSVLGGLHHVYERSAQVGPTFAALQVVRICIPEGSRGESAADRPGSPPLQHSATCLNT